MSLIAKYNVPIPRYTSYPTVPYWDQNSWQAEQWLDVARRSFDESNQTEGISIYIHLPFCESLCTFCGCTKRITKNHDVEQPYIEALHKEWQGYLNRFEARPQIRALHLGGGSPTFFAPAALSRLIQGIFKEADLHPQANLSFEANPNTLNRDHLIYLAELGFRRISFGIQDFDPLVQEAINRIQPVSQVAMVHRWAQRAGFTSINFDLVYGLPYQTLGSLRQTFDAVAELMPQRIAFYSYAHVPWIKGNGQRKFSDEDLPRDEEKRELYELGRDRLLALGYEEIGMDHFALPEDSLHEAWTSGTMHRNFMGYTEGSTKLLIGLGMSAISDGWYGFAQNPKTLEAYYERLEKGEPLPFRGHTHTEDDLLLRRIILALMCQFEAGTDLILPTNGAVQASLQRLQPLCEDGLVICDDRGIRITEAGRPFLRNICAAFDARLWERQPETRIFSMSV